MIRVHSSCFNGKLVGEFLGKERLSHKWLHSISYIVDPVGNDGLDLLTLPCPNESRSSDKRELVAPNRYPIMPKPQGLLPTLT